MPLGASCLVVATALGATAPASQLDTVVGGMAIEVTAGPGEPSVGRDALRLWIENAARDVSEYLGAPPLPRVRLRVRLDGSGRIGSGRMFGGDGDTSIRVAVGRRTTEADLANDWVLTHEMFHLVLPDLPEEQAWMEEGLATYLEPVARVRRGRMTAEEMWRGLTSGVRHGLPTAGDPGLDGSPSWGSTYWGGALFWLLADVGIRERSGGRRSLADALREVRRQGGDGRVHWPTRRLLAAADAGAGAPILSELYEKMGRRPMRPDLAALWRRLGVSSAAAFDDTAPLADLRRAITAPEAAPRSPGAPGH
jgi:hypothetical protein